MVHSRAAVHVLSVLIVVQLFFPWSADGGVVKNKKPKDYSKDTRKQLYLNEPCVYKSKTTRCGPEFMCRNLAKWYSFKTDYRCIKKWGVEGEKCGGNAQAKRCLPGTICMSKKWWQFQRYCMKGERKGPNKELEWKYYQAWKKSVAKVNASNGKGGKPDDKKKGEKKDEKKMDAGGYAVGDKNKDKDKKPDAGGYSAGEPAKAVGELTGGKALLQRPEDKKDEKKGEKKVQKADKKDKKKKKKDKKEPKEPKKEDKPGGYSPESKKEDKKDSKKDDKAGGYNPEPKKEAKPAGNGTEPKKEGPKKDNEDY